MNEGWHPPFTGFQRLETVMEGADTPHMENFPTPHRALVPQLTNALTLAVVVATAWWSSGQRPVAHPMAVAASAPATPSATLPAAAKPAPTALDGTLQASSKSQASLPIDGIVAVGFSGSGLR